MFSSLRARVVNFLFIGFVLVGTYQVTSYIGATPTEPPEGVETKPPLTANPGAESQMSAQGTSILFETGQEFATALEDPTSINHDQPETVPDAPTGYAGIPGDSYLTVSIQAAIIASLLMVFAVLSFIGVRLVLPELGRRTYYLENELRASRELYHRAQMDLAHEQGRLSDVLSGTMQPSVRVRRDRRRARRIN